MSKRPDPIQFRDGAGAFPAGRRPGMWCAKKAGGEMVFIPDPRKPEVPGDPAYFESPELALKAVGKRMPRQQQEIRT